jgi:hypothetical protein
MMRRLLPFLLLMLTTGVAAQPAGTVRAQMDRIETAFDVHFVYDSGLPVEQPSKVTVNPQKSLRQNLTAVFRGTGINWSIKKNYVVLTREQKVQQRVQKALEAGERWLNDTLPPAMKVDTLPAAVKTALRQTGELLPGTFTTDMKALRGKVLSPVGENDPLKFAMTRPGVSSGAEGFSAIFARGGNLGSNLFTLDGMRLYGYSHLLGLTTAVPSEAISTMDFCLGGFGGEVGGLTASHIALHSPDLLESGFSGEASLSNTFLGASVTAPVVKDKTAVMVVGRWSPFGLEYNLLKKGFDKDGRMPSLSLGVWDLYAKAQWQLAPRHTLTLSGFGSRDGYVIGFPSADYTLGWENLAGHLSYVFAVTGNTTLTADVSYNHFKNRMEHEATIRGEESYVQLQSRIEEQNYAVTGRHTFLDGHFLVSEGLRHQRSLMSPGAAKVSESVVKVIEDAPYTESISRPTLTSGFLELEFNFGPVNLMTNVRGNYYKNNTAHMPDAWQGFAAEFSVRAKWRIIESLGIEATFDDRTQFDHTLEGTPLGWSLDLIVPTTKRLLPERAKQGYAGVFTAFGSHAVTVGGYYKKMQNLVYYTDAMALFTASAQGWSDHAEVGDGTSYGAEFLYEGRLLKTGLEWSLAYTWSKTDRSFLTIDGGKPFPARYDRRHILHAGTQWKGVSAAFTLQSGYWETVAAGQYIGYLPTSEVMLDYFSHPNNWQMPLYMRLDLGYQMDFTTGGDGTHPLQHSLTIGIFNVLNRHNPSMLAYDSDTKTWNQVSIFPIMPSIKYTLEF